MTRIIYFCNDDITHMNYTTFYFRQSFFYATKYPQGPIVQSERNAEE